MKNLIDFIIESTNSSVKKTLFPRNKLELQKMIENEIKTNGVNCSLNHIDVSEIRDMSYLFHYSFTTRNFNGDISQWDVSNVTDMTGLFKTLDFNGDISQWDVSNVTDMEDMFAESEFNQDISQWNVNNVSRCDGFRKGSKLSAKNSPF